MTPRHRRAAIALLVLAALGCLDTVYLLLEHMQVRTTGAGSGACDVSARFNCAAAALSSYAELYGVPIAGLGLAYYIGFAVLVLMAMRSEARRPVIVPALVALTALATAYSVFLLVVSLTRLSALCPACCITYAVNLATFAGALFWATPHLGASLRTFDRRAGEAAAPFATFALILVAVTAGATVWSHRPITAPNPVAAPAPPKAPALSTAEVNAIAHAAYAPSMGPASANVVLTVFSDFECPHCARFAATLRRLHRNYGDALRIEYRNYPLSMHKNAELAARLGVCAEQQGKFWGFHDLVFEKHDQLNLEALAEIADDAGVDARAAMACADRSDVKQIIAADIAAGEKLGIEGTPAFVLNGELTVGAVIYDELERRIGKLLQSNERAQLAP
ncbi:MAG: thioredoxin domain-containing protein [Myxococcota bacterium]|nr:thioredoxin domain-containing protein [Myxococcota bacterium]